MKLLQTFGPILLRTKLKACHVKRATNPAFLKLLTLQTMSVSSLRGVEDRYKGMHVDLEQLPSSYSQDQFETLLSESLHNWYENKNSAAWLRVPIMLSHLIPIAAKHGFVFHHAENGHCMLCLWMIQGMVSRLPKFATHQVGVSGCVIKQDTHEVLVVQDKNRPFTLWKFPGGLSDLGEDIAETAEREILEETGVQTQFQGVLCFRQQHENPGTFGRSDFYFICHMKPLSYEITPCEEEIEECQWMHLEELEKRMPMSGMTLSVIELVKHGLQHGFDTVNFSSEELKSVFKGLVFKIYSKNLPGSEKKDNYMHSIVDPKGSKGIS